MNLKDFNIYVAAYIAILIPLPGRFVYGITVMLELFLLMMTGTLIDSLIKRLKLQEIRSFLMMVTVISFTILYRQILVLLYSEIALTLGYYVFLPAVSLILLQYLFDSPSQPLAIRLKTNILHTVVFNLSGLLFCLVRDLCGYGTFTFFGKNHQIFEKVICNPDSIGLFSFIASISGALMFSGILLYTQLVIRNKMRILKNSEVNNVVS